MQKIFITLLFIAICFVVHAQQDSTSNDYKSAVGLKFYPGALTAKTFIKTNAAVEGLFSVWNYGVRLTGLYEFYHDITGVDGLKWYVGPGAHVGFWNNHWKNKFPTRDDGVMIGVDGIVGLDYKIKDVPVDVSLDWQPSFNFIGYNYFEGGWGGLGVRYTF